MSKRKIEAYIPKAIDAIKKLEIAKENKIDKEFNGYISSFGASIRQAGLLATVLFYGNTNSNSEKEREKIIYAIEEMIGHKIVENHKVTKKTKAEVEYAAIALKLAIRSYTLV